jgi:hypothetical protein
MTAVDGSSIVYPALKKAFSDPASAPIARELLLASGVWFGTEVYRSWPVLVPWAVRDNTVGHAAGQDALSLWAPNAEGYMRSDNSPVGRLKVGLVVDGATPSLHGRTLSEGWGQVHVWHQTATDPVLNSFVPNLVWLPLPIMKLTDHAPVVQAELQRLAWEIFRNALVDDHLRPVVERAWRGLPVARYAHDRAAAPVRNTFITPGTWLNGRRTKLQALVTLLRALESGSSSRSVAGVQPKYKAGLRTLSSEARQGLLSFLAPFEETPDVRVPATAPKSWAASGASGSWLIFKNGHASPPMPKNRAVHALVVGLVELGVAPEEIRKVTGFSRWRPVGSQKSGDALWADFAGEHGLTESKRSQWFVEGAVRSGGSTWLLQSNVWGKDAETHMAALAALAPGQLGFGPG